MAEGGAAPHAAPPVGSLQIRSLGRSGSAARRLVRRRALGLFRADS